MNFEMEVLVYSENYKFLSPKHHQHITAIYLDIVTRDNTYTGLYMYMQIVYLGRSSYKNESMDLG